MIMDSMDMDDIFYRIQQKHPLNETDYGYVVHLPLLIYCLLETNRSICVFKDRFENIIVEYVQNFNALQKTINQREIYLTAKSIHTDFVSAMSHTVMDCVIHDQYFSSVEKSMENMPVEWVTAGPKKLRKLRNELAEKMRKIDYQSKAKVYARMDGVGAVTDMIYGKLWPMVNDIIESEGISGTNTHPEKDIEPDDVEFVLHLMHNYGFLNSTLFFRTGREQSQTVDLDQELTNKLLNKGTTEVLEELVSRLNNKVSPLSKKDKEELSRYKDILMERQLIYKISDEELQMHFLLTKILQLGRLFAETKMSFMNKVYFETARQSNQRDKQIRQEISLLRHELEKAASKINRLQKENAAFSNWETNLKKEKEGLQKQIDKLNDENQELISILNAVVENTQEKCEQSIMDPLPILHTKNVTIIGGHPNWQKKMKETLPEHYRILEGMKDFDGKVIENVDCIFVNVQNLKHGVFYKMINSTRQLGIAVGYIPVTSVEKSLVSMAQFIIRMQ